MPFLIILREDIVFIYTLTAIVSEILLVVMISASSTNG